MDKHWIIWDVAGRGWIMNDSTFIRQYTSSREEAEKFDYQDALKVVAKGNITLADTPHLLMTEYVCTYCGGEGYIATDEEDGEGHTMRGVGRERCHNCNN